MTCYLGLITLIREIYPCLLTLWWMLIVEILDLLLKYFTPMLYYFNRLKRSPSMCWSLLLGQTAARSTWTSQVCLPSWTWPRPPPSTWTWRSAWLHLFTQHLNINVKRTSNSCQAEKLCKICLSLFTLPYFFVLPFSLLFSSFRDPFFILCS